MENTSRLLRIGAGASFADDRIARPSISPSAASSISLFSNVSPSAVAART
jgi:hypothetical protein